MQEKVWPANPAPLGLAGFGVTTLLLSLINANLVGVGATPAVLGLAFAFGGLAQFMAGMWEFRAGNTFGAVAFTSFGAFWISYFILVTYDVKLITPIEVNSAIGAYLWCWAFFTGFMFLCSFNQPWSVTFVFFALTVTFVLLGIGKSGTNLSIIHAGGWAGLVTAAAAMYTSSALVARSEYGRWVLPIGAKSS